MARRWYGLLLCIGRQHKLPERIEVNPLVAMAELEEADLAVIKSNDECAVGQEITCGSNTISMPDSSIISDH